MSLFECLCSNCNQGIPVIKSEVTFSKCSFFEEPSVMNDDNNNNDNDIIENDEYCELITIIKKKTVVVGEVNVNNVLSFINDSTIDTKTQLSNFTMVAYEIKTLTNKNEISNVKKKYSHKLQKVRRFLVDHSF